ncbi:hypothetical protein [Thalassovita sp.]|uniref:hypothetical protein n=1 Tax=Thalassovita sp. TaxID=1979401 RepID=UPI00288142C7|nr:hypothetical protein [Thalassovita sp.]MDF1802533.1 hypothetical protein [Thalassovita sp.]
MSEADKAYEYAVHLIEQARLADARILSFDHVMFHPLERVPNSLLSLQQLESLDIGNTGISDLSLICELRGLRGLRLNGAAVRDLSPVLKLVKLGGRISRVVRSFEPNDLPLFTYPDTKDSNFNSKQFFRTNLSTDSFDFESLSGISFTGCVATKQNKALEAISQIANPIERTHTLFEYLRTETIDPSDRRDLQTVTVSDTVTTITIPQLRAQFQANRPEFSSRLEHLMALVQQEQAVHNLIPIPNEEAAKAEYDAKSGFLSVVGAELIALRDELPQDFARQLSEDEAKGLKTRLVKLAELTDTCIKHLDKDHGTYGGLYKIGLITAVAGLLSVIPGLNMIASTALAGGVLGVQTVRLHIGKDDD